MKHYNITTQEGLDYTLSRSAPIITGADLYRSTGETEEKHWSGPWSEMLAMYNALEASYYRRLRATLKRSGDGDFGELTATWSLYTDGAGQTGESAEEKQQPGTSRDCPEYDLQLQTVQEPILTHYKWKNFSEDTLMALKMLMDGYKRDEPFLLADGTQSTVGAQMAIMSPPETYEKILQGVTAYNAPHAVLTVRYRAEEVPAITTAGSIVDSVPGGFATPPNRNWYFHGPSWSMKGSELWVTEVYELSSLGGWDDYIYDSAES